MSDPHDHGVPAFLDFGPELRIVVPVGARFGADFPFGFGILRAEQFLHLRKQLMGVGKCNINNVDGLSFQIVDTARHRDLVDRRRLAERIQNCDLGCLCRQHP